MTASETPKLAVFDCDGTLVDGQAAVCEAMLTAFDETGLPAPDLGQVRRIVGLSLPQAIRSLAADAGQAAQAATVEAYKSAFRNSRMEGRLHEPLFPGMRQLIESLHTDGWLLAVATGKSDSGLTSCLAHHGITNRFVSLQAADRHPSKPDPAMLEAAMFEAAATPGDSVMIGDTTFDIEMARAANVRAIGVAWGYHEREELLAAGASAVAETMAGLEDLIRA